MAFDYDYLKAVTDDVIDYIRNEVNLEGYDELDDLRYDLNDQLFYNDKVTGYEAGSYTHDAHMAEEYVANNWCLIDEMGDEFGAEFTFEDRAETIDVMIRCHLLARAIDQALKSNFFVQRWEESHKEAGEI